MYRLLVIAMTFSLLATLPAQAQATSAKAAVAALVAAEHSRFGNNDVEKPSCYVLQGWAQCDFGTGGGNAEVTAWLHYKSNGWGYVGSGGGVTYASMMEKQYGIPVAVAKKFQARLCPSPCPGS
jgi:uncharacterized membrane protein